ncbi:glycerol kinase GlpK [Mycobacterium sp. 852002-51057_SCH5723018]|uniref:glycerol kinase GlpK n=1 Tax=Mycobacterium sp. 852002-51057_SCH5723018 TaxID=1834094 RepID=UPI0012E8F360|nr:glycerol kinase GlpK [Mycobacterium sp. 852002-51057_SCH5723018]
MCLGSHGGGQLAESAEFIAAIDQGTTSTRCMIFDHDGAEVARHQLEHEQILPRAGWVEHDPVEIWERTSSVLMSVLNRAKLAPEALVAVGITNQRETTLVWNWRTGRPYYNAIVWQDTRTDRIASALDRDGRGEVIRRKAGLPPAAYFSGGKLQWILENVDGVREAAESGDALFGTADTWVLWNLTGGPRGGVHVTDVTNASRTMLMNLETLDWDDELLSFFSIPRAMLPAITSSSPVQPYGVTAEAGPLGGEVPITGVLGDQHAAMVGQVCLAEGEAKNTYGTGNFLLLNTGETIVRSDNGLLTTVCYQFGDAKPVYALEGSIAVTGSAVQWLRDQLGIISGAAQSESLARQVADNGGVYFVPAFSGLFAPYWRSDARGAIVGLSRFNTNAHLARATLEAICYQSRDVVDAMEADSGVRLEVLKVDGGITQNELCMQIQADVLGVDVVRPVVAETTALGAAYAAGLSAGFWADPSELRANWQEDKRWTPAWSDDERAAGYDGWRKAVQRTLDWVDVT